MHVAAIKTFDIANGPGVRTSLFVSGCTHHCPGCFNSVAWDFAYGEPYTETTEAQILDSLKPDFIDGLSLLGGEPMEPENQEALLALVQRVKRELPGKTVWCYSGYTLEELTGQTPSRARGPHTDAFLASLDVLVDGRFVEAKKDMLDHNPSLRSMYSETDDNTEVLYLKDATATFSSFTAAPRTVTF